MFVLQNLRLEGNAHVVDFKNPRVSSKFELISNNIASLGQVFPKHADMLSNGQFSLNAQVEGHVNQLDSFASQLEVEAKLVGANFGIRLVTTSIQPLRGSLNMTGEEVDIDRIVNPFIDSKYLQPSTASLNSQTNNVSSQSLNPASPQSNLNANEAVSPPPHQDSKSESSNIEKSHSDSAAKIDQPDFTLTSSQRRLLADSKFDVSTNVAKLIFKGAIFENLKFYLKQNDFKTSIQHLDSLGFGGAIMSKSSIDFMPTPLKFSSNLSLKGIHPELLTAFFAAEQKDLITGIVNFNLDIEGRGTSKSSLKKTLGGKGAFKFTEGSLRIPGIKSQMTDQLDSAIAKLTIDKDSSSVVSIAKKLLDSPLVKMTGKKPPDLDRIVDSVQSAAKVRISNTVGESRSLDGLNGNLEIKDGKVFFPMSQNDPLGEFNTKTYLDFDLNLGGTGTFLASNKAKTDMLEQSQYAKLLFDEHESFL
ncbi:MAG: AsmA family protein, partial [Proteobacteria bacterium]|nr:AsmA family protein [Pseudomonadota bacterium]